MNEVTCNSKTERDATIREINGNTHEILLDIENRLNNLAKFIDNQESSVPVNKKEITCMTEALLFDLDTARRISDTVITISHKLGVD